MFHRPWAPSWERCKVSTRKAQLRSQQGSLSPFHGPPCRCLEEEEECEGAQSKCTPKGLVKGKFGLFFLASLQRWPLQCV